MAKVAKSGGKVGKSGEELLKVMKSGEEWRKVVKSRESGEKCGTW